MFAHFRVTVRIFWGQVSKQYVKVKFRIWGPITIWYNLLSTNFFLSQKSLHPNVGAIVRKAKSNTNFRDIKGNVEENMILHEIIRVVSRFPHYISCYSISRKVNFLWYSVKNMYNPYKLTWGAAAPKGGEVLRIDLVYI